MELEERGLIVIGDLTEQGLHRESTLVEIGLTVFGIPLITITVAELEAVLYAHLASYAGLVAIVSDRIYPMIMPQDPTYPSITFQRIDGPREHAFVMDAGLAHPRIQVDSWGKSYASVKSVATQLRGALERWADETTNPVVLDSLLDNDEDTQEAETGLYRIRQDWVIWYRET